MPKAGVSPILAANRRPTWLDLSIASQFTLFDMKTTYSNQERHPRSRTSEMADGLSSESSLSDPLVQAFERAALDGTAFHHREHLYVAWCYLCALPLEDALARYVRHLRRLTIALGVPHKFHVTLTWAYVVLLRDAMDQSPGLGFDELLARHPTLLDRHALVAPYYDRGILDSEQARLCFVLPRHG